MTPEELSTVFNQFVDVIKALRTPETGCPWDLEQNHKSLRPYLIEESYEVLQAIDTKDDAALCDELGDVLLQVVLHAQVASDREAFGISDVIQGVMQKMIRRHPHVFSDVAVTDSDEVLKNWEAIKRQEDESKLSGSVSNTSQTPLADRLQAIPQEIPALIRAQRIGEKAAKISFDWKQIPAVITKVQEELGELLAEIDTLSKVSIAKQAPFSTTEINEAQNKALSHELGDLLFSISQLARWLGIGAEDALRECSYRFIERFREMERVAESDLSGKSELELEALWQQAKSRIGEG